MNNDSMAPSFSMMHVLCNGFNIVVYRCIYNKLMDNDMIHNGNELHLILLKGMYLIFHQDLIHSEGKSRLGPNNETLTYFRLFYYLWTESNN